ncbi:glycoside hydrolase family 18 protein [Penicillium odoratum]|uniref:glycoside hydrolase family 18 protein n=1 Tax=Penicillium odoratum TaxID=1167516 RepID=UPI0025468B8E|nr:glycoside hydrolase family 18 protein [Penicillium odoratum]KAJ5761122.1 glycoside hydrolase family 18 protein [Penicillium odoratum]
MGQSTNPETNGFLSCDRVDATLAEIAANMTSKETGNKNGNTYQTFGGVMGWQYCNSLPGGTEKPWMWAKDISQLMRKHFHNVEEEENV